MGQWLCQMDSLQVMWAGGLQRPVAMERLGAFKELAALVSATSWPSFHANGQLPDGEDELRFRGSFQVPRAAPRQVRKHLL